MRGTGLPFSTLKFNVLFWLVRPIHCPRIGEYVHVRVTKTLPNSLVGEMVLTSHLVPRT